MTVLDCLCPPKGLWLPGPPMPTQGSLLPGCPSCLLVYHHSLPGTPPCRCTFFPATKLFSFYSAWSLLCSPGWPWTHWEPPASAPKAHTMSGSFLLLFSVVTCLVILFFSFSSINCFLLLAEFIVSVLIFDPPTFSGSLAFPYEF